MLNKTALVTGSSGFIGYHVCSELLKQGWNVIGVDSLSDYYDVSLKVAREEMLKKSTNFSILRASIETPNFLQETFDMEKPEVVIHLAAQAGVRYSIENPRSYLDSNIAGTFELLEAAKNNPPKHMLMASTSSAYGANEKMPYLESDKSDHQLSFYAATKKATESFGHSYSYTYNLPITMFRFFTVYGPWGRPDMALFKFTKAILNGDPIDVYNYGNMQRDFTYIDDLTQAIIALVNCIPDQKRNAKYSYDNISSVAPFRVVNIGNSNTVNLSDFIDEIENVLGLKASRNLMPIQVGDVPATWADCSLLHELTGYRPKTCVRDGVKRFVEWYRAYYDV